MGTVSNMNDFLFNVFRVWKYEKKALVVSVFVCYTGAFILHIAHLEQFIQVANYL